ncbi:MAG: hypothetical protein ABH890_04490 [Bacillota bacterium]
MEITILGAIWIVLVHIILIGFLKINQKPSLLILKIICLYLITYKSIEYGMNWIQGDFTKIPLEYSAISYFLFSITYLFNVKSLKPFVTFAAFFSGINYILTFPFLGPQMVVDNGLISTLFSVANHGLLYLGSMIVMKNYVYTKESRKAILIYTFFVITYTLMMPYLITLNNSHLFIYPLLDGRMLNSAFGTNVINGLVYIPYYIFLISCYWVIISLFYKINSIIYRMHHDDVITTRTKERRQV